MLIPCMLYTLNSFGQRLVSINLRQLAIYNIPMRTQYFYPHPHLNDLSYYSFMVIKEDVIITGGIDY
jgi:hypothetical protein